MPESITNSDCCGETLPTNPKKDFVKNRKTKSLHLFRLENPIPKEVEDSKELKKLFDRWNFIPYAGDNKKPGHNLLNWYLMLAKLSPTNGAAIAKKITFALGGKAKVVRAEDPEFFIGENVNPVSNAEASLYVNTIKELLTFEDGVSVFHNRLAWQYEASGNAFVEVTKVVVMSKVHFHLRVIKCTNIFYVNTAKGEPKAFAISPVWTEEYLKKNEPEVVTKFPVWTTGSEGQQKCIFHLKAGANNWYGRPESESGDIYKYREVQDSIYQMKAAANDFTGQLIIEVEDDNPEFAPVLDDDSAHDSGQSSFVSQFEQNFTQKGDDPQSVVIASRPFGSKPMFVFQIEPNTKEKWYKTTGEIAEYKILRSHMLSPRFMGFDVSNGFSSDTYLWDYILNVEPVINEFRSKITNFVNKILTEIWQQTEKMEMNNFSLTFTTPIQSTLEDFKEKNKFSNNQPKDNSEVKNNLNA